MFIMQHLSERQIRRAFNISREERISNDELYISIYQEFALNNSNKYLTTSKSIRFIKILFPFWITLFYIALREMMNILLVPVNPYAPLGFWSLISLFPEGCWGGGRGYIYCDVPGSPCLSKTGAVYGLFFFLNFWVVITRLTDQRIPWPMSCRCLTISSRPNLSDFEDISKNDFAQVFLSISPSIMVRFQKFKNRLTAADPLYQFMAPWLLFGKKDTLISDLSDLSLTPKRHPFLRISVHTC